MHQIRIRLHQGERQKAARGELRLPLPADLTQEHEGGVALNPDKEVQARLRLLFDSFRAAERQGGDARSEANVEIKPVELPRGEQHLVPHTTCASIGSVGNLNRIRRALTYALA